MGDRDKSAELFKGVLTNTFLPSNPKQDRPHLSRPTFISVFENKFHWNYSIYGMIHWKKIILISGCYKNHCNNRFCAVIFNGSEALLKCVLKYCRFWSFRNKHTCTHLTLSKLTAWAGVNILCTGSKWMVHLPKLTYSNQSNFQLEDNPAMLTPPENNSWTLVYLLYIHVSIYYTSSLYKNVRKV